MDLRVEYFAAARELSGCEAEVVSLPGDGAAEATLRQALGARHPALAPLLPRMRLAVNGELHATTSTLRDGDEIAVLPPVAGGSDGARVPLCEVWDRPLSVDATLAAVSHPGAGGVAIFIGVVRDHAEGKAVARLDYEAHPKLAPLEMRRVLEGVAAGHPGARLAALHRVGELGIGDHAVVVGASAPHRGEAFAACRAAIDRIKETVPIWKKEWDAEGQALWVNLEG